MLPCHDCGGSGVAHCCDGIQEQRDPGDETAWPDGIKHTLTKADLWRAKVILEANDEWPDRLGRMERDVTGELPLDLERAKAVLAKFLPGLPATGCADDWAKRWMEQKLPEPTGCADDCCHPSHGHLVQVFPESVGPVTFRMKIPGCVPDTHDEWRILNDE